MILDDLNRFYEMKANDPASGMPAYGWSTEKVAWEFRIDEDGRLVSVLSLGSDDGKRKFAFMRVPVHRTRTSAPRAFFLCDTAAYLLGISLGKGGDGFTSESKKHLLSCELHCRCLDDVDDDAARAVLRFLDSADSAAASIDERQLREVCAGGFIVFRYLPDMTIVHEREAVAAAWQDVVADSESGNKVQCAVTGEISTPASLFPQITGFPGAQSAGASLVSFNLEAFCSYGRKAKDKAANASISDKAAFKAGTALKYLMQSSSHHIPLGDSQLLFWTEAYERESCQFFALIFDPDACMGEAKEDEQLLQQLRARLSAIKSGRQSLPIDSGTRYYLLCLAPNAARLSVRFFETGAIGELERAYGQYLRDVDIVGQDSRPRSIRSYVYQAAAFGKAENVPDTLVSSTLESLVRNRPFPQALYNALLQRTRVDKGKSGTGERRYDAMPLRAAMFKACLLRWARQRGDEELERSLTVALNEGNENIGYVLGRLFAILEKAQSEAVPGANATIRDRYIGAASTTPARVFPQLLKLAQHHVSKAEYGGAVDRRIEDVMSHIDGSRGFPPTLSYDDQGQFFIGYYQQREAFYQRGGKGSTEAVEEE